MSGVGASLVTTADLVRVVRGHLLAGHHVAIDGVSLDSRTIKPGQTFFCVRGPRFDGHAFAAAAVEQGAAAIVAERNAIAELPPSVRQGNTTLVAVGDTRGALRALAMEAREKFDGVVVGITGSSGKTTTKEMVARVLATRGSTLKTEGNQNNDLGVPLTLLRLTREHDYAVVEMGISDRGELPRLLTMGRPHIGVITSIGHAHTEGLGGLDGVARAKSAMFEALPADGLAVMPSHIHAPWILTRNLGAPLVTVGRRPDDDVALAAANTNTHGVRGRARVDGELISLSMAMVGEHNLENALIALAVGRAVGVSPARAAEALTGLSAPRMRGEIVALPDGGAALIDCYNANPESTSAAISAFEAMSRGQTKVLILGDMLELGDEEVEVHRGIGAQAAALSGEVILLGVGSRSEDLVAAAREAGLDEARALHFDDAAAASEAIATLWPAGASVLIKGSRGVALERIWAALRAHLEEQHAGPEAAAEGG